MRRLLYVPILHSEADLGSLGPALTQRSATLFGARRWALHQETVRRFWESVAAYLWSLDSHRLKVYQDGLPAGADTGRRIVEEAARRGSDNYRLVLELLERGAELRQTEDPRLLLREHENLTELMQQGSVPDPRRGAERYQAQRDRLLAERDAFIAETIGATLKHGELGVLFIGAYHNVMSRLPAGVSVEAVKDPNRVTAYFAELLRGQDDQRLAQLAQYLREPVGP